MAKEPDFEYQTLCLREGEQIFVNGALIEAHGDCQLRLGRAASVVRGTAPTGPSQLIRAIAHLYGETVRVEAMPDKAEKDRFKLIDALNTLTAQLRTNEAQAQCSRYVGALGVGDTESALAALRALALITQRRVHPGLSPRKRPKQEISLAANT